MEKITIRAFKAIDDPVSCERYLLEHAKVLVDIGVISSFPVDRSWLLDGSTIVLCAIHEKLGMVAGVRIQKRLKGKLPLEKHLAHMDKRVVETIDRLGEENGELCGLWNAHRFAGRGIPMLLMTAAIAVASQAGLESLTCLAAEYMVTRCEELGFGIMTSLGDSGSFVFPVATICSFPMILENTTLLHRTPSEKRKEILGLRLVPEQERQVATKGSVLCVTYRLLLHADERYAQISVLRERYAA